MKKRFWLGLILAINSTIAQAAPSPCEEVTHNLQILPCAESAWAGAQQKTDAALVSLKSRIRKEYIADPSLGARLINRIDQAQQLWGESVEADCGVEAFEIEEGAQAHQVVFLHCSTKRYEERAAYLDHLLAI
ncbi:lysozyme inhibitor LprI family protein [Halopseudomonas bauzanensis]|uniref:DUF1311 domain-containing protein n=1 Tax=Halopseudomonas bauzanensis TaxID=653930 RepID=A0A1H9WFJ2_9GAMM|nr:lysozyme inhibitor LprI family protein [Halopseudomonas bauzanensis]TKA91977.1 DUF1311 domain-containing protein [Halopseudomonas bauzanensis]SES32559.1 Protein of unknown function [Halopseudomonas bauzanensis]SFM32606.1 Protein of unknown function [Halopseudomonas bauzanensis]